MPPFLLNPQSKVLLQHGRVLQSGGVISIVVLVLVEVLDDGVGAGGGAGTGAGAGVCVESVGGGRE